MSKMSTKLIETQERQIRRAECIATDKRAAPNTRAVAPAMVMKLRRVTALDVIGIYEREYAHFATLRLVNREP